MSLRGKSYSLRRFLVIALLPVSFVLVMGIVAPPKALAAYSGTGYFSGAFGSAPPNYGTNDVLFGRPGTAGPPYAIPASAYASKGAFILFIQAALKSPLPQEQRGAAFIVNTMVRAGTGGGNPAKAPIPSAAMIADFVGRINSLNVSMVYIKSADPNTYTPSTSFYDPNINDEFFANYNSSPRPLLFFEDPAGTPLYILEVPCGNPLGGLAGLPPVWALSGSSLAKNVSTGITGASITAQPGQTITFIHTVKNGGPSTSSAYNTVEVFAAAGPLIGTPCVPPVPLNVPPPNTSCVPSNGHQLGNAALVVNGTKAFSVTSFVVPASALGKQYCQLIGFDHQSPTNNQTSYSVRACVTVVPPPPTCNGGSVAVSGVGGNFMQPGDAPTLTFGIQDLWNQPRIVTYSITDSKGNSIPIPPTVVSIPAWGTTSNSVTLAPFAGADGYVVQWSVQFTIGPPCPNGAVNVWDLPYVNAYGASVRAGGNFSSIDPKCLGGGLLASWNNNSGASYGSGTQLAAIALINIVGFASAQTIAPPLNYVPFSGLGLNFANDATVPRSNDLNSPNMGGNFDTGHCLTSPPKPAGAVSGAAGIKLSTFTSGIYHYKGPLNINHATKDQLETLPGIDSVAAGRIIAGRPYQNSEELPRRHVISRAEYHQIATKIEAR